MTVTFIFKSGLRSSRQNKMNYIFVKFYRSTINWLWRKEQDNYEEEGGGEG